MSSTGSANLIVTRDEMISASLRVIRVLQTGETPPAADVTTAAQAVNFMLKAWQAEGLMVWCYQNIAIPCVAGQTAYTIGTTSADVTITRPVRLFDGAFIRKTVSGVVTDTPLQILSRQAYEQVRTKAVTGTTAAVYYEPGIYIAPFAGLYRTSPSTGYGTLYLYYPSVDNTYTIYGNFQRQVYDMNAATDEFDFPVEWFQAIKYGLAAALADEYEVPETRCKRLIEMANFYKSEVEDWQRWQNSTNFGENRQTMEKIQMQQQPK